MSPRYVDKEKRVRDITHAALEVFSSKGYTGASVDSIAVAAGVSKGTVYEYFSSKEKLYIAVVNEFANTMTLQLKKSIRQDDDPFLKLVFYICSSFNFCCQQNSAVIRMFLEILQESVLEGGIFSKQKHIVTDLMRGTRTILTDILLDGVAKGVFVKEIASDAEKMATNIMAFIDGASLRNVMTEHFFNASEQISHCIKLVAKDILAAPVEYDINRLVAEEIGR